MRILVTGAAGFIGSHTVDALLEEGVRVFGVDNLRSGNLENLSDALRSSLFQFEELDATDLPVLSRLAAIIKPDAIIHLAGLVSIQESIEDPALNYLLNVHATHVICEVSRQQQIPRIVFASSAAVYGEAPDLPISESSEKQPLNPYGWAKLASESLLFSHAQSCGFTALSLRYFNVYGQRQGQASPYSGVISRFAECLEAGRPLTIFGTGEQTRDFIHVRDVARANRIAATKPELQTAALNICTGRPTSIDRLYECMTASRKRGITRKYADPRQGDIRRSVGDGRKAQDALSFSALIGIEEGICDLKTKAPSPSAVAALQQP